MNPTAPALLRPLTRAPVCTHPESSIRSLPPVTKDADDGALFQFRLNSPAPEAAAAIDRRVINNCTCIIDAMFTALSLFVAHLSVHGAATLWDQRHISCHGGTELGGVIIYGQELLFFGGLIKGVFQ